MQSTLYAIAISRTSSVCNKYNIHRPLLITTHSIRCHIFILHRSLHTATHSSQPRENVIVARLHYVHYTHQPTFLLQISRIPSIYFTAHPSFRCTRSFYFRTPLSLQAYYHRTPSLPPISLLVSHVHALHICRRAGKHHGLSPRAAH